MRLLSARLCVSLLVVPAAAQCHHRCSGHGTCGLTGQCECWSGYQGPDCSQRSCPRSTAWVDFPSYDNTAHAGDVECSNRGECNRATGQCACGTGYGGAACERRDCPGGGEGSASTCSGHGVCMSMRSAAAAYDGWKLNHTFAYTSDSNWDAEMIHGWWVAVVPRLPRPHAPASLPPPRLHDPTTP